MKKATVVFLLSLVACSAVGAQEVKTTDSTRVLTLEDALSIALSENVSVKVADMEITRTKYAKRGTYAALFPQVDASGAFNRTIQKQVMYMDFDMSSLGGALGGDGSGDASGDGTGAGTGAGDDAGTTLPGGGESAGSGMPDGLEVGRWNTFSAGVSAAMPLVNVQLWESLKISGQDVELAVEKARSSRLEMVSQVKQAFFAVLLAKESLNVYEEVYDNAIENFKQTEKKYNVQKASELDYIRAKTSVNSAIPNVYQAENAVFLALWQLKAVMGVDLDMDIDVAGSLGDWSETMFRDIHEHDDFDLNNSSTMRQLAIQAEQLATAVRVQRYADIPTLSLAFSYSQNAMTNDFDFSQYRWNPYSYIGLSLNIPIFAGGKRRAAVKQAQVQYNELKLQQENTERQLRIAIRQYLSQMETGLKSLSAAESTLETARKAYDIAAKSYNVGRSTLTDLNDAQLALTQARLGVSQCVYNFMIAKSNLEQTLGVDYEDPSQDAR